MNGLLTQVGLEPGPSKAKCNPAELKQGVSALLSTD